MLKSMHNNDKPIALKCLKFDCFKVRVMIFHTIALFAFRLLEAGVAECCFNYYNDGYECRGIIHLE